MLKNFSEENMDRLRKILSTKEGKQKLAESFTKDIYESEEKRYLKCEIRCDSISIIHDILSSENEDL